MRCTRVFARHPRTEGRPDHEPRHECFDLAGEVADLEPEHREPASVEVLDDALHAGGDRGSGEHKREVTGAERFAQSLERALRGFFGILGVSDQLLDDVIAEAARIIVAELARSTYVQRSRS